MAQGRVRRVLVFCAIVAAHLAALRFFPSLRLASPDAGEAESPFIVLSLPPPAEPDGRNGVAPSSLVDRSTIQPVRPSVRKSPTTTPSVAPESNPTQTTAPISIDWASEIQAAASHSAEQDARASRQASALTPWKSRVMPAPVAPQKSQFGWDHAHTHRVEPMAGGVVVNISDRCAIVVNLLFPFGGCKLGKISARGDLFDHMRDPPPGAAEPAPGSLQSGNSE